MKIEWPVFAAVVFIIMAALIFLIGMIRERNRAFAVLEAENKLLRGELLHTRSQAAKEIAEINEEKTKRVKALQQNVSDVTAVLKERSVSEWRSAARR